MPKPANQYRKKGFKEVHTLSEFLNVPSILNKAVNKSRRNELRKYGITPLNTVVPGMQSPPPMREATERNKKKLEASILRSLNWNNNDNLKLFGNLQRNRTLSNASDPKTPSRPSSTASFEGGRRSTTRKMRNHKRHQTYKRKH